MRWWRAYVEWFEEMRRRQGWDPGKSAPAELTGFGGVGALLVTSIVLALRGCYWAPVWFFLAACASSSTLRLKFHSSPVMGAETSAHGSLLCQDAWGSGVLGLVLAGPGSDLSEEPVWGCEPAALD